jgi:hypothetical protein
MAILTYKSTSRDRLFYDRYEYSVQFHLHGAGCCRNPAAVNQAIMWRNGVNHWTNRQITDKHSTDLHNWLAQLNQLDDHKVIYYSNHVYLYTNSQEDIEHISQLEYAQHLEASKCVIDRPRDTIVLKSPTHKYRTFFKERYMEKTQADILRKFLLSRQDCFRITRNLTRKLEKNSMFYTSNYYFVDHNDMNDIVMLQLVCPGIVRKTLAIQDK